MTRSQFFPKFKKSSFSYMSNIYKLSGMLMTACLTGYLELSPNGSHLVNEFEQMEMTSFGGSHALLSDDGFHKFDRL